MTIPRPRTSTAILLLAMAAVTGCGSGSGSANPSAAPAAAAAKPAAVMSAAPPVDPAITPVQLRFADPDDKDRPSQPYIDEFLRVVKEASGGAMTVDVLYGAGATTSTGREKIVTDKVMSGDVELAIAPVRAWSDAGVDSVQALGAPLLIDSDSLATAVATDPLVQPLLDAMSDHGLVGLTVWPEDLRHPFAWDSTGGPLLKAADFKGASIWALPSKLQTEVIETLGAKAVYAENADTLVADGTIRGAETGLASGAYTLGGFPTATGDVTLYPKYQVLVAEDSAWSRLTPAQQAVIRKAATAANKVTVTRHPTDAQNAAAYCQAGGRVVLAGPDNVATFVKAVQPMIDRMSQDPLTATAIKAIQALKAATPAEGTAVACAPSISATATLTPVVPGPATTLVPDGVYRLERTKDELLAQGVTEVDAGNNAGTWTLRVAGGTGTWELDHANGSGKETCALTFTVRKDRVRLVCGDHPAEWMDFRWTLDGDRMTMAFVDSFDNLEYTQSANQAIIGGPWTKVE
jgi:TRAP-type C4-dicarboxylate transport system substrate-binding protein